MSSNTNENRKGYKNTPLGWIPEEWDLKRLGELGKISIGLTYNPEEVVDEQTGTLVLRSSNIQDSKITFIDNIYVKTNIPERAKVKNGDILICVRNGSRSLIGKSARIDQSCNGMAFGAFMSIFRSEYNDYLIHLFQSGFFRKEIYKNLGATINQITSGDLWNFKISLPSIIERNQISSVLDSWVFVIEKTQKLIELKEKSKKALMQQLLTGKKRLRGFTEKWKYLQINAFAKEISSKNRSDKDLIVLSCTKYDGLVSSLVYFGRKIYSDDLSTYKIVPKHSFAYATNHIEEGSIGYQKDYPEALISPMYTVFKTNGEINDNYLFRILKSYKCIHEYNKRMEGSINRRGGLRWDEFSKIKIHIPGIAEQNAIDEIFITVDKEIDLLKHKLEAMKQQKKGLMQVLLTGKIRVKVK